MDHHHEPRCLSPLDDDLSLYRVPDTTNFDFASGRRHHHVPSVTAAPGRPLGLEPDGAPPVPSLVPCGYEPDANTSNRNAIRRSNLDSEASLQHRRARKQRALRAKEKRRLEETLQQLTQETEQLIAEKTWLTQRTSHLEKEVERQTKAYT